MKRKVWLIWKEAQTGRLLGPVAPFWPPTRVVYAVKTEDGWEEVASEMTN